MKIKAPEKSRLYQTVSELYEYHTELTWAWEKGEKARILCCFEEFCEAVSIHDTDRFESVYKAWHNYAVYAAKNWIGWSESRRSNYVSYLVSSERMNGYLAHKRAQRAVKTNVAGFDSANPDKWGF